MRKIYYDYDPLVQTNDYHDRFAVNYYCTDGNISIWSGRIVEDSPTATLYRVRELVNALNTPRPLFGFEGRLHQWFWWRERIRNEKKS
jgi:hypothetical protein